jgi:polysaccharide pyruvyl transferase WcaK-like protein
MRCIPTLVVRERISLTELSRMRVEDRAIVVPDVAFIGTDFGPHATGVPGPPRVGFVVMDWTWARPVVGEALGAYRDKIVAMASELIVSGVDVVLLGHSTMPEQGQDDSALAREIAGKVNQSTHVDVASVDGSDSLPHVFAGLDVVVGTRLHSCILALAAGTPAIALGYQPKALGTYELLGLADLHFDVESFSESDVLRMVGRILEDGDSYRERVRVAVAAAQRSIYTAYGDLLAAPSVISTEVACASSS